jgi:DNA (cytosine-5)-methyltransferase 1
VKAFYNEIDPAAATWLENLIADGLIADGDVCRTSIVDLRPSDLAGYTQVHFFAGIGGWSLALRMAGWPDSLSVWTGSCPCQPFSLAGKQKGFADDRHLWPYFRNLIGQCRPPIVFGEQVASATQWLGLVRSDLEALEYAVGCMPIEAASAGADHLRDRYWFVGRSLANAGSGRRGESCEGQIQQPRRTETVRAGGFSEMLADAERDGWQQGTEILCGRKPLATACGENIGENGVVDAISVRESQPQGSERDVGRRIEHSGKFHGNDALANGARVGERESSNETDALTTGGETRLVLSGIGRDPFSWVIGADGKARRVKSGIRLLAHGIPGRVAKLRGFGNAIDPRPAAAFIRASGLSGATS